MLGAVAVRYVDVALDEGVNPHQDLVPIGMYYEEEYPFNDYPAEPVVDEFQQVMMIGQRPNNTVVDNRWEEDKATQSKP